MAFILRIINLWLPVRKGENMDFFEIIYGLMYGEYVLEGYRVPLSHIVRHEFRPGSKASRIWQRAGDARERIARRLGTDDEDPDLLAMVESYEELQEYMCRRCYEYGKLGLRPARRGGQKGKAPVAQRRAPEPNEKSRPCAR
jgi:hypothetical protein